MDETQQNVDGERSVRNVGRMQKGLDRGVYERHLVSRLTSTGSVHRRGMVTPAVIATFASIGWGWGGSWSGTKDYMHFSSTGH